MQASGTIPQIYFNNGGDKDKILTVEQWGNNPWTSMANAFHGATNLRIPATDAPDLSGVTNMSFLFHAATVFNDPINHWDVSNVTNMARLFAGADAFNQPLNNWDVSRVTTFLATFKAASFNQPIGNWIMSSTTDMYLMFDGASSFN